VIECWDKDCGENHGCARHNEKEDQDKSESECRPEAVFGNLEAASHGPAARDALGYDDALNETEPCEKIHAGNDEKQECKEQGDAGEKACPPHTPPSTEASTNGAAKGGRLVRTRSQCDEGDACCGNNADEVVEKLGKLKDLRMSSGPNTKASR